MSIPGPTVVAFAAGAATVAAFAPVGAFPLALLTYAALIHVWIGALPRRAFWTGWVFGLGLFGAGVSWVYVSLHDSAACRRHLRRSSPSSSALSSRFFPRLPDGFRRASRRIRPCAPAC